MLFKHVNYCWTRTYMHIFYMQRNLLSEYTHSAGYMQRDNPDKVAATAASAFASALVTFAQSDLTDSANCCRCCCCCCCWLPLGTVWMLWTLDALMNWAGLRQLNAKWDAANYVRARRAHTQPHTHTRAYTDACECVEHVRQIVLHTFRRRSDFIMPQLNIPAN